MTRRDQPVLPPAPPKPDRGDEGYLLIGVLLLVFMVLLTLSVAAPKVAMQLKREKEIETQHRANQYVRGIRMYYKKFQSYPGSMTALEKSNNQKFLRQHYIDPMTGKDDWKLIAVGQNKTKVKGFFGEDLPGIGGGLGAAAGMQSSMAPGANTGSAFGNNSLGTNNGSAFGNNSSGSNTGSAFGSSAGSSFGSSAGSSFGSNPGTNSSNGTGSSSGANLAGQGTSGISDSSKGSSADNSGSSDNKLGSNGPIMGVGVPKDGQGFLVVNEKDQYQEWEFLYDPRIEQLYAKGNLLGGGGVMASSGSSTGVTSTPLSGLGNLGGSSATPSSTTPGSTTPGSTSPASSSPSGNPPNNPGLTNPPANPQ